MDARKKRALRPAQTARIQWPGIIAQLEERMLHTHEVTGSSPVGPISNQQLTSTFFERITVFRSGCHWVPRDVME